jgi:serine/threonine protein kinase
VSHDDSKPSETGTFGGLLKEIARPEGVASASEPDLLGATLHQFRVLAVLGSGGMGVVYRADDTRLGRQVALKVLPRALSDDEDRRRRFLREARSAAAITHPNIATVYEVEEAEGRVFLVMELVEGETLHQRLGAGPLPIPEAVRVGRAIALGLAKAHDKGIVHRDLKPDNVMITRDGDVKILDFGLAKVLAEAGTRSELENLPTELHVTREGVVVGTLAYMSPEQASGAQLDRRTDLFSVGVVLYEMVTGRRPFDGSTRRELLASLLRDEPLAPSRHNPSVGRELERAIQQCLRKKPEERIASAEDLLVALEGKASVPARKRKRSRVPLLAGAGAVLAAVAVLLGVRHAPPPSSPAEPVPLPTAMTDFPPLKTSSPEAAREYGLGMQSARDGSYEAGLAHMSRAVELDPSFALAQLIVAWAAEIPMDERRKHLAVAVGLREQLGERDQGLLEVVQWQLGRDRPDVEEEMRRWRALADRFPMDALLVAQAGNETMEAGHRDEGAALLDRALMLDPKFAWVCGIRAGLEAEYGDLDGAIVWANRCLAISPSAATCLRRRAEVEQRLGQCARLEEDARQMIALEPNGAAAYDWLASALIAQKAPIEAVGEALRRERENSATPSDKASDEVWTRLALTWLSGDFTSAVATFPAVETFKAEQTSDWRIAEIVSIQVTILEEMGELDRAVALAEAYLKRRPVLVHDAAGRYLGTVLWAQHLAGRLPDAEFREKREAWAQEARKANAPFSNAWFEYYAQTAVTAADARGALEALPRYAPLPAYEGIVNREREMGHVLLLAGRVDEAVAHLRRAVTACSSQWSLPSHQLAAEMLGEALEAQGNTQGACDSYGEVLEHWGNARPRSRTADAARTHGKKLGCAK